MLPSLPDFLELSSALNTIDHFDAKSFILCPGEMHQNLLHKTQWLYISRQLQTLEE